MRISKKTIQKLFQAAEADLNQCWNILCALKGTSAGDKGTANDVLFVFQDKLAGLILKLHQTRTTIIAEEKLTIKDKGKYNSQWFLQRLRKLAEYKKAIDQLVAMIRQLGDAYAFFFYRHDLALLQQHLTHVKIVNAAAGIGEIGEIEFLKRIKHFNGHFVLYHGITNILRYGDYSFVDLSKGSIVQIAELKTKQIDEQTLELNLAVIKRNHQDLPLPGTPEQEVKTDEPAVKGRKARQLKGVAQFLRDASRPGSFDVALDENLHEAAVADLYQITPFNGIQSKILSPGLAYVLIKLKKSSLFSKFFGRESALSQQLADSDIISKTQKLMKPGNENNSLIISQVLHNDHDSDGQTPGTIPLFWYQLPQELLRKLYFRELIITTLFNPIHLIEEIEALGFTVDSPYIKVPRPVQEYQQFFLSGFDRLIDPILAHLGTETSVINSLKEVLQSEARQRYNQITIKPQLHFSWMRRPPE